ncbi:hypothetical protein COOONC_05195, partial [Cooperia oncophora]
RLALVVLVDSRGRSRCRRPLCNKRKKNPARTTSAQNTVKRRSRKDFVSHSSTHGNKRKAKCMKSCKMCCDEADPKCKPKGAL